MSSVVRSAPPKPSRARRTQADASGDATREVILLTAQRLFAERGIAATSLRHIRLEAGQKNNAAIHYHFGDREGLIRAIFAYSAKNGEQVRGRLLGELISSDHRGEPRDVVNVVVMSLASYLEKDDHYLAFLSRYIVERGDFTADLGASVTNAVTILLTVLPSMMPGYPDEVIRERWGIMLMTAVHTMARYQTARRAGTLPRLLPDLLADLIAVLTDGLKAPWQATEPVGDALAG